MAIHTAIHTAIHKGMMPKAEEFVRREHKILIDGRWLNAASGERIEVINPANGKVFTSLASAGEADVEMAVKAASKALKSAEWSNMTPVDRSKLLWKIADIIDKNADELAEIESLDNGKPYKFARMNDVNAVAESFRYYAGWCTKICGKTMKLSRPGPHHAYTIFEPVGVVGLIIPWNFPLMMAGWKFAPALAAGCTCVMKPSEETSLSVLRLAELMMEAGLPNGVINIITGYGDTVGNAMTVHKDIKKIAFTGSTRVGKEIVTSALGNLKKVSLELGGKSPVIIMPDAAMEAAIPGAAMGIFFNSGQVCAAGSRLYVHRQVYEQVVEGICKKATQLKVGPGYKEDTILGPLVNATQHKRVSDYVRSGISQGAVIATGGEHIGTQGYFYQPTVITNTNEDMKIVKEEIFGPVLAVNVFDDIDEALKMANNSDYGLTAKIWTNNLTDAHYLINNLEAGSVSVNGGGPPDNNMPFGGYKQSGWGQELGEEGLRLFLNQKSVEITL